MNYYRRYIGDYQRDTAHLSIMEHGVYALLLDAIFATESGLCNDIKTIRRICRAQTPAECRAVDSVLAQFFTLEDGKYMNPRAKRELEAGRERAETARENGAKGGRPKNPAGYPARTRRKPNGQTLQPPVESSLRSDSTDPASSLRYEAAADAAPDEIIWGAGVSLITRSGVSESSARSFLGGLRKSGGDEKLAEAIWRCMAEKPVDPRSWLKAAMGQRRRKVVV